MADTPGSHIVEIRAGTSQRPVVELRPGEVVQPMSIGRVGMWAIDAPDVLDVHAYMYFDGRALFVQSADAQNPAKGNGKPIGMQWQQIEIPCTIEVGRARLVYRTLDDVDDDGEDKTVAQPIQIPREPASGAPFAPGAFSNRSNKGPDSDATRLAPMPNREPDPTVVSPLEMVGTPAIGVPKARPAAGMPAWSTTNDASPNSSPTAIGAPPAPPPPQNTGYQQFGSVQVAVPAPPPAPNAMVQTLQAPMQSPLANMQPMMQPGMQPMMQPGMQGFPQQMQPNMMPPNMMPPNASGPYPGMPTGPNAETGRVQPPTELKGFARMAAEWKAMPPIRKVIFGCTPAVMLLAYFMVFDDDAPAPQPHRKNPQTSDSVAMVDAAAPTTSTSTSMNTTPPAMDASVAQVTTSTAPPPTTPLPKGKRTPEREAIDLVSQGQFAKAADIYEQLAQQHPEQPAFKEAARILRLRANGQ